MIAFLDSLNKIKPNKKCHKLVEKDDVGWR